MKLALRYAQEPLKIELSQQDAETWLLECFEKKCQAKILQWKSPCFRISIDGVEKSGYFAVSGEKIDIHLPEGNFRVHYEAKKRKSRDGGLEVGGSLSAPMPGKVLKVCVEVGQEVKKGEVLMVLEAMKMEHQVLSPRDGKVSQIFFQAGERVTHEAELLRVL